MRVFLCGAALLAASLGPLSAQTPSSAQLILGGYPILRLRGDAGGLTPDQRIGAITDRLTPLLGNPVILPSDIVVYLPPPASRVNRDPVIYVLGRRIVTVDPSAAKNSPDGKTPQEVAAVWAKRLQQILPRVNWRPSNAPETKVPANPPLLVTSDFSKVGGQIAAATLRDKVILRLRGPQTGGMTAAERADLLSARLERLANQPAALAPDAVQVTDLPTGAATLALAGTPIITVAAVDVAGSGFSTPDKLANAWAKNLRGVLAASSAASVLPPSLVPSAPSAVTSTPPATEGATVIAPTPRS